ncbi:unnamed protein product [Rhodiola kirilowii]
MARGEWRSSKPSGKVARPRSRRPCGSSSWEAAGGQVEGRSLSGLRSFPQKPSVGI